MTTTITEQEHQVLYWMSHGCSNREIGTRMYLSEDTVKTYARRLFQKVKANDRAHAVRLGFEHGLLSTARLSDPATALIYSLEALGWTPPRRVMSPERAA